MANSKLAILSMIRDKKDILFGKFSDSLTHKDKEENWKTIAESAKASGLLKLDKSWTYFRDTTYMNWRRATVIKRDNKNKTGSRGGSSVQYNDCDLIILDIIGKDSPSLNGIAGVIQSSGTSSSVSVSASPVTDDTPSSNDNISDSVVINSSEISEPRPTSKPATITTNAIKKLKRKISDSSSDSDEIDELKAAKLKLQIEGLKLENEKRSLDIVNYEKTLGLPYSARSIAFLKTNFNVVVTSPSAEESSVISEPQA